jgi:hypothetical protein
MAGPVDERLVIHPSHPFDFRDLVFKQAPPDLLIGRNREAAIQGYLAQREDIVLDVLDARIGANHCFHVEWQSRESRRPSQWLEVRRVYLLFEVAHWPTVAAQADYTSFLLATIEFDQVRDYAGSVPVTGMCPWCHPNSSSRFLTYFFSAVSPCSFAAYVARICQIQQLSIGSDPT